MFVPGHPGVGCPDISIASPDRQVHPGPLSMVVPHPDRRRTVGAQEDAYMITSL